MPRPQLAQAGADAIKARFGALVESLAPELTMPAQALLDRISPPNWALEWLLPGWAGEAVGLSPAAIADLTLANVLGLAYVRLQDDLADGEAPTGERSADLLLSTVLYQQWLATYVRLFAQHPEFWSWFERYMAQWVAATWHSRQPISVPFSQWGAAELRILGERGAPLKICAAGACLLAERKDLIPQLASALDHLLIAAVLVDHAQDWASDLASARYNAFVAYASPAAQTAENMETNRRAVLQELMLGKAARPYFAVLREQFQVAAAESQQAGVPALTGYIIWLRNQAGGYGRQLAREAAAQLHNAVGQVLGVDSSSTFEEV